MKILAFKILRQRTWGRKELLDKGGIQELATRLQNILLSIRIFVKIYIVYMQYALQIIFFEKILLWNKMINSLVSFIGKILGISWLTGECA